MDIQLETPRIIQRVLCRWPVLPVYVAERSTVIQDYAKNTSGEPSVLVNFIGNICLKFMELTKFRVIQDEDG